MNLMLGWLSGLKRRFAKPLDASKRPEGSNPSHDATYMRVIRLDEEAVLKIVGRDERLGSSSLSAGTNVLVAER